jgi:hypothetical protein
VSPVASSLLRRPLLRARLYERNHRRTTPARPLRAHVARLIAARQRPRFSRP